MANIKISELNPVQPLGGTELLPVVQSGETKVGQVADLLDFINTNISGVLSVNGLTGEVVLTPSSLDLANVDNTADVDKIVSGPQQTALNLKVNISDKGVANGVASLDSGGLIPSNQLPAIAISDTFTVASQAAMLALTAQVGDVAIRTDNSTSYILSASPASTLANWKALLSPGGGVTSVDISNATGITFTGGPITSTGSFTPALSANLQAWSAISAASKLDASSYTAADVLAKLVTVDGSGSGLDADLLDGQSSAYFLAWANFTGVPGLVVGPSSATDNAVARFDTTTGKLVQDSVLLVGDLGEISGYKGNINAQTGTTYTLVAADSGKVVTLSNASAITLTLPNSLPAGFVCTVLQKGAGTVTFSAAASGTLRNRSSHTKTAGQWAMCSLYIDSNGGTNPDWVLAGDTQA